jgi:hypothetical protein
LGIEVRGYTLRVHGAGKQQAGQCHDQKLGHQKEVLVEKIPACCLNGSSGQAGRTV